MNILEITPKEYQEIFSNPYHIFNSAIFNELNKYKCDSVHYLIFRDSKIRLGLIIGKKENIVFSPFSAPFGCFSFLSEQIDVDKIEESLLALDIYLKEKKISNIKFVLPPFCYSASFLSKLVNSLSRNNYKISHIDLNHIFKTSFFNEKYKENIYRNARKNLNIAFKQDFVFAKTDNIDLVYNIISKNRELRGFPLRMTLEQIKETIKIIKYDSFVVKLNEDYVASALVYYVAYNIVQVIYWGDIPEFSSMKTMNFLSYKVFEYYKNTGIEIIDIGPSTENGFPNYGLCYFKESIGCSVENKFTFWKRILNIEFIEYSKVFLKKSWEWLNDKEIKELTMTPDFTKEQQEQFFSSLSRRENYFIKGITYNSLPIGACGLKNITEKDGEYWGYIGEKKYWGQGIGKEIVKYIVEISKEKYLESVYLKVSVSNVRAKRLYEKIGFKIDNQQDNVIIMRLNL